MATPTLIARIASRMLDQAAKLPYTVECRMPPSAGYDTIAAFNVRAAALAYARDCAGANPNLAYRVRPEK